MSKRISNKRGTRKTPARSRVSYGWRKSATIARNKIQHPAPVDYTVQKPAGIVSRVRNFFTRKV